MLLLGSPVDFGSHHGCNNGGRKRMLVLTEEEEEDDISYRSRKYRRVGEASPFPAYPEEQTYSLFSATQQQQFDEQQLTSYHPFGRNIYRNQPCEHSIPEQREQSWAANGDDFYQPRTFMEKLQHVVVRKPSETSSPDPIDSTTSEDIVERNVYQPARYKNDEPFCTTHVIQADNDTIHSSFFLAFLSGIYPYLDALKLVFNMVIMCIVVVSVAYFPLLVPTVTSTVITLAGIL